MRILVLCNPYPPVIRGGYEIECEGVVEHLRREHEVVVLSSGWDRAAAPDDPGVLRDLPRTRVAKRDSLAAPVAALRAVRATRRTLAAVRPEVVYVWNAAGVPYATVQVLHEAGVPVLYRVCEQWFGGLYDADVFMRHLTPGERGARGAWARGLRLVNRLPVLRLDPQRRGRAAVCWNSEFLRSAAPAPPWLTVVHGAVVLPSHRGTEDFAAVRNEPVSPPMLLFAANLGERKGGDVAVRALGVLARRHGVRPRLVLGGGGSDQDRARLQALAGSEGVGAQVSMPGVLDRAALLAHAAAAAVWLVPSVWDEPAGMTCIEAALAGVPVVASRVGGIPEVLHDEEHALLFERGDAEGCADAVARSLTADQTGPRVARARERGARLAQGPYLERMDRFFADGLAALARER